MFPTQQKVSFKNEIEGTWGVFSTPAGKVAYLMTKVRLGSSGIDNERRLTAQLRPVREVLDIKTLDFNQLLQRDLDDHRVASALLPYILKPRPTGPAFFPPIVAALLPFADNKPTDNYPVGETGPAQYDQLAWIEQRFGNAFSFRQLADNQGKHHSIKLGRLLWNDELSRLMVLDGQHRAMALLAIERTVAGSWDRDGANRYKHFYEQQIKQLLADSGAVKLEEMEVPVTIIWFPDHDRPGRSAQKAARQLFVDVNKEARTPSEARLILLSDAELKNVLTRSLLNRLRSGGSALPLYAIEYDNPMRDAELPARWSVLTNINLLKIAVTSSVFGPRKYAEQVNVRFGGRLPEEEMDNWARTQLNVANLFPEKIEDGERVYERALLGNKYFPVGQVDKLVEQFLGTWGDAILTVLSELLPYSAHVKALQEQYDAWATDDALGSLARDALFEGVGMYWTLRDAYMAWQERRANTPEGQPEPTKPDVAKAWTIVTEREPQFCAGRSMQFLGKANPGDVARSDDGFAVYKTHACQFGAILTVAAVRSAVDCKPTDVAALAKRLVKAWNASLTGTAPNGKDRRLVLSRKATTPINRVGKMDTPLAVYFRYMWLELLLTPEAKAELGEPSIADKIKGLADSARLLYLDYLKQEQAKALRKSNPGWTPARVAKEAHSKETGHLQKALAAWFGVPDSEFQVWLAGAAIESGAENAAMEEAVLVPGEEVDELATDPEGNGEEAAKPGELDEGDEDDE